MENLGSSKLNETSYMTGFFKTCGILDVHCDSSELNDYEIFVFFFHGVSLIVSVVCIISISQIISYNLRYFELASQGSRKSVFMVFS